MRLNFTENNYVNKSSVENYNKKQSGQLLETSEDIGCVGLNKGVVLELRGLSEEEELYYSSNNQYSDSFRSAYVNDSCEFKGSGLTDMVSKYDKFYNEIENSDLSDKEKDIKKYALQDAFSMHTFTFSNRVNGEVLKQNMAKQYADYQNDSKSLDNNEAYSTQRSNSEKIMKLTNLVIDYYNNRGVDSDTTNDVFLFLERNKVNIKEYDEKAQNLYEANEKGTEYVFSKDSDDVELNKNDVKNWRSGYDGFEEMRKKYNLN